MLLLLLLPFQRATRVVRLPRDKSTSSSAVFVVDGSYWPAAAETPHSRCVVVDSVVAVVAHSWSPGPWKKPRRRTKKRPSQRLGSKPQKANIPRTRARSRWGCCSTRAAFSFLNRPHQRSKTINRTHCSGSIWYSVLCVRVFSRIAAGWLTD